MTINPDGALPLSGSWRPNADSQHSKFRFTSQLAFSPPQVAKSHQVGDSFLDPDKVLDPRELMDDVCIEELRKFVRPIPLDSKNTPSNW